MLSLRVRKKELAIWNEMFNYVVPVVGEWVVMGASSPGALDGQPARVRQLREWIDVSPPPPSERL